MRYNLRPRPHRQVNEPDRHAAVEKSLANAQKKLVRPAVPKAEEQENKDLVQIKIAKALVKLEAVAEKRELE